MKRLLSIAFALPLLAVMLLIPAQASKAAASRTASKTTTAQRGPTPSDAQIDAAIRTKLAKSKIGKDGFKYHVQRGVVTWEGNTNVMQHKGSATRMARTAGATQVINNIQISASAKAKAASNLKKAEIVQ
ncbi:MAG: BON domain-containing protein [Acidobacteriota bacterium]|nr:BON domain-containing protein [Acidobacteriota bacterium]